MSDTAPTSGNVLFAVLDRFADGDDANMPAPHRAVLIQLANRANRRRGDCAWPSVESLAKATGYGRSTVRGVLADLESRGWIMPRGLTGPAGRQTRVYEVRAAGEAWPVSTARRRTPPAAGPLQQPEGRGPDGGPHPSSRQPSPRQMAAPTPPGGGDKPPIQPPIQTPIQTQMALSRPVSRVEGEGQDEGRGGLPLPTVTSSPPSPIGREAKGDPPASTIPKGGRTCSAATYRDDGDPRCADCQDIEERQAVRAKKAPPAGTTPPLPGLEDVAAPSSRPDPVAVVWEAYLEERQRHLGAGGRLPVLDDKRRAIITRALKSYSLDDVCAAVRGIWRDGFHREKDWKYATVEVALRDASHIEQFRELGASAPAVPRTEAVPPKRDEPRLPPGPRRSPEELKAVWEMFKHEAGGQEWLGGGA